MIIRKIGIIGYGFVGKATEEGFQKIQIFLLLIQKLVLPFQS